MFGIVEYIAGGLAIASLAVAGYQTVRAERATRAMTQAEFAEARALGSLETCANRLTNIQEAAESNASIPDDLSDFDIPAHWMRGEAGTNPASD